MSVSGWLVLALVAIAASLLVREVVWKFSDWTEVKIPIENTSWSAAILSNRCSFSCVSYQGKKVVLLNSMTGERVDLVIGADVIMDKIESIVPQQLRITLSNLTVSSINEAKIPGLEIVWKFEPQNDPSEREAYKNWVFATNKSLESVRKSFCSEVFPKLPGSDRMSLDRSFAWQAYGIQSAKQSYCLSD